MCVYWPSMCEGSLGFDPQHSRFEGEMSPKVFEHFVPLSHLAVLFGEVMGPLDGRALMEELCHWGALKVHGLASLPLCSLWLVFAVEDVSCWPPAVAVMPPLYSWLSLWDCKPQ